MVVRSIHRRSDILTVSDALGTVATLPDKPRAQVVKLVDTLASGASDRKVVEVQVLSWAPNSNPVSSLDYPLTGVTIHLGPVWLAARAQ